MVILRLCFLEIHIEIFMDEMTQRMACASESFSGGEEVGRGRDTIKLAMT